MSLKKALLIVDHGSRQPEANQAVVEIARMTKTLRPDLIVEYAHMEMVEPNLATGVSACVKAGADEIRVQPYLLADGRHTRETIPELVDEAALAHPDVQFRIAQPLGPHEQLAHLVLLRMDELDAK